MLGICKSSRKFGLHRTVGGLWVVVRIGLGKVGGGSIGGGVGGCGGGGLSSTTSRRLTNLFSFAPQK